MELEKKVMERYPKTHDERYCAAKKQRMEALREIYRTELKKAEVETPAVNPIIHLFNEQR